MTTKHLGIVPKQQGKLNNRRAWAKPMIKDIHAKETATGSRPLSQESNWASDSKFAAS